MTIHAALSLAFIIYFSVRSSVIRYWGLRAEARRANADRRLEDLRWRLLQREREQVLDRVN